LTPDATYPAPVTRTRRIARAVWLRGFLPALVLLVVGLSSTGMWVLWQGPGRVPLRFAFGSGSLTLAWDDPSNSGPVLFGPARGSYLSVGYTDRTMNTPRAGWNVMRPLWSSSRFRFHLFLRVYRGQVQLPMVPIAALLALWPAARLMWRWWHPTRKAWECRACGYDLRGSGAPACPECGATRPALATD
jgi:hypothetical protein